MMGWEDDYPVEGLSPNGLGIKPLGEELPRGAESVGKALSGFAHHFMNPPDVPPLEVYGARGGSVRRALSSNPATISPTVASENIDMQKFLPWYQEAVAAGLHPDVNHPDMNTNVHDIFARGGKVSRDENGFPGFMLPDGKFEPFSPGKHAMWQTPEQSQQSYNQQKVPLSGASAGIGIRMGTPTVTTVMNPVPPADAVPAPLPKNWGAEPANVTPPAPATPVATAMSPSTTPASGQPATVGSLLSYPNVAPTPPAAEPAAPAAANTDQWAGKLMSVAGMVAAAANPKQFGEAGAALTKLGESELTRARGNAGAALAGYKSQEHLAAVKEAASIAHTQGETELNKIRGPWVQAETQKLLQSIPGMKADEALTIARTKAQNLATQFKAALPPQPVTFMDPSTGQQRTVNVDGEHVFNSMVANSSNLTHFIGTMATAGHMGASTDILKQQLAHNAQVTPVQVAPGVVRNFNNHELLTLMAQTNKPWADANAKQLALYKNTIEPFNKLYEGAMGGRVTLPQNLKIAGQRAAMELMRDANPMWRTQGEVLWALAEGGPLPSVSAALATPMATQGTAKPWVTAPAPR
jgi:hypothetical protein